MKRRRKKIKIGDYIRRREKLRTKETGAGMRRKKMQSEMKRVAKRVFPITAAASMAATQKILTTPQFSIPVFRRLLLWFDWTRDDKDRSFENLKLVTVRRYL